MSSGPEKLSGGFGCCPPICVVRKVVVGRKSLLRMYYVAAPSDACAKESLEKLCLPVSFFLGINCFWYRRTT